MLIRTPWIRGRTGLQPRPETRIGHMVEEFEHLAERLLGTPEEWAARAPWWGVSAEERDNEVLVRAELPGFAPEEVRVEVLGERLTVEAEHAPPAEAAEGGAATPPREHTRVRRVLTLPPGIDTARAEATFRNGVLEVHLPRAPEAMARRIEVKT